MLLDDELSGLTYLKMLCEQLTDIEVVRAFDNPITFLKEIDNIDFDFCILDIEMPEMNGLQVANLMRNKPLIFATAYKEYATEAFDLNAIDYIRKPIKIERLKQAVEKVKRYIEGGNKIITKNFTQLNTDKGKTILFFDKIAYIKSSEIDARDKVLTMFSQEQLVLKNITFDKLIQILPQEQFCRVNRKEIISLHTVQVFSHDEITTNIVDKNGSFVKVSLSENYKNDFFKKIQI